MTFSLVLTPEKSECPAGTIPSFKVVIKNVGPRPAKFCAYMLKARLMANFTAENEAESIDYELLPFRRGRHVDLKPEDIRTIPPGKGLALKLDGLAESAVWGFVNMASQPPHIPSGHKIRGFPPGAYVFRVKLSERAAVYVGQPDIYDHRWAVKKIPDELPGARPGAYEDVFRGLIKARAEVRIG